MAKLVPARVASERALPTSTDEEDDLISRVDDVLGVWAHEKGMALRACVRRRGYGPRDDAEQAVVSVEWGRDIVAGIAELDFTEQT